MGRTKTSQLETELAMKSILTGLAAALVALPAFAAVDAAPASSIGLGVPAIAALVVVALIAFVLKYTKV
jgi:hypothetical protein